MLFLLVLHLLQDGPHIELHASDEGHLQHKGPHEVVEHVAALLLQVHSLVFV